MKHGVRYYQQCFTVKKRCAFCSTYFYAMRSSAKYCCNSCKQKQYLAKKEDQKSYTRNENQDEKLPVKSPYESEMTEDKLVFAGDLTNLFHKLIEYLSDDQLIEEEENISNLLPLRETGEWAESSIQVLTDQEMIEVFRIMPDVYKLYVCPWEDDNEMTL